MKSGDIFRTVFNAGVEASFKVSREWEEVQSRALGLDGLRHVIQPFTDFSWVSDSGNPAAILQFDRFQPSTQLPPIDFPQFTPIDSIDNWTIWRVGVRNRLQTRRDDLTVSWLELETYFDVNFDNPFDQALSTRTFSTGFASRRCHGLRSVVDSQVPAFDKGFTEVNTSVIVQPIANLQLTFGHRYLNNNPFFLNSSLLLSAAITGSTTTGASASPEQYEGDHRHSGTTALLRLSRPNELGRIVRRGHSRQWRSKRIRRAAYFHPEGVSEIRLRLEFRSGGADDTSAMSAHCDCNCAICLFVPRSALSAVVSCSLMDLSIIGSGYVGLVTGACFADVGHNVICVDNDPRKVESLQAGKVPIYEPGLEEVIHRNVSAQRLRFTGSIKEGVDNSQIVFIAVPTPQQPDGSVDLSFIEKVAREIAGVLTDYRVIVDKSTVPVKTGEKVAESIKRYNRHGAEFDVVSNPEFLREGCAVADLMHPDRIVIGAQSEHAIDLMKKVYEPFMAPILVTDINSAELIKHAANSFLALKISYINAVSAICEASGADVEKVADGIGMDRRIGRNFLNAGIGYGGSCFPKDIAAFITISEQLGVPFNLLKEVQRINADAKGSLPQSDARHALGLARQENRGLGTDLQTGHRRHSFFGRDRSRGRHVARGRAGHRLRSQGNGKGARSEGDRGRDVCRTPRWKRSKAPKRWSSRRNGRSLPTSISRLVKEKMTRRSSSTGAICLIRETMAKLGFHYHSIGRASVKPG